MNQCSVCGVDFASLAAFDEHVLSAPGEPDFDCLQVAQMQQAGWGSERQGPLDESEDRSRRRESFITTTGRKRPRSLVGRERRHAHPSVAVWFTC
jgi:hypothetical protein